MAATRTVAGPLSTRPEARLAIDIVLAAVAFAAILPYGAGA
ncbi:MAG TPA: hypothetical protein VG371_13830 [Solirubrobacteraceae bacterium]|nr:hypothetical protein [Solirubrobacteraceae bacterium]